MCIDLDTSYFGLVVFLVHFSIYAYAKGGNFFYLLHFWFLTYYINYSLYLVERGGILPTIYAKNIFFYQEQLKNSCVPIMEEKIFFFLS